MKQRRWEKVRRYRILNIIAIILFLVLLFRLSSLTIAQGDYYREKSENMRVKSIYTTAPRGEIRDRNGVLLAGNKPVYTLQIIRDEFSGLEKDEKNKYILNAINILEKDAIEYNRDFPINVYDFRYKDDSKFLNSISPYERVYDIIVEHQLVKEIITRYYKNNDFLYFPAQNLLNNLEYNTNLNHINFYLEDNKVIFKSDDDKNLDENISSIDVVINTIYENPSTIKKLLYNPINRKIIYDILVEKNLQEDIILKDFEVKYYRDYINTKYKLMDINKNINFNTDALDDFGILFKEYALYDFLKYEVDDNNIIIPEIIKEIFNKNSINYEFTYEVKDNIPIYTSSNGEKKSEELILDEIFSLLDNKLLEELLMYENVASHAQKFLIAKGVNPNISVNNGYEYSSKNELNSFNSLYGIEENDSDEVILKKLKDYYKIDKDLSLPEVYGMLNIYNELSKSSNLSYLPINFSYNLKNKTVAKIEEQMPSFSGFNISLEPIRYYPYGNSASHILGYMGKISQESEIDEYVKKEGYNPDTIIGKTGLEETFQKRLYGIDGYKKVEVDNYGNTTNIIEEKKPKQGENLFLTIDYNLQKRLEKSLADVTKSIREGGTVYSQWGDYKAVESTTYGRPYKNATSAAAVALDIKTGEILAMASYPSYDPNLFSIGISSADWDTLNTDSKDPLAPRPLLNIASQTSIQPGSTFKMITGLTALEKGVINKDTKINDMGYITVGDTTFACWLWNQSHAMHGYMNLVDSIRDSCNYFFYTLAVGENLRTGEKLNGKIDIEDINKMSKKFGLGEQTGIEINIPKEASIAPPDPVMKKNRTKNLLKNYLNNNIDKFYIGVDDLSEEERTDIIEKIVLFLDNEKEMSLKEVYDNLKLLKIDGTKNIGDGTNNTLADLIKFTYIRESNWSLADTLNITIGQGENAFTLLQMTNYASSIANGGNKNKLTLVNRIKDPDNKKDLYLNEFSSEKINLNNYENLDILKEGMKEASLSGLNKSVFENFPVKVGIKTGTAERSGTNPDTGENYDSFSYEIGFAPYDNPRIAVGVLIFQGGAGSNCSPIIRDIVAEYMGLYNVEENSSLPNNIDIIP